MKPKALIIEDDEEQLYIFAEALRSAEFDTEVVRDGRQAISRFDETQPAVVILDLHLPYVSGEEILAHIRAQEVAVPTRVILATADPHTGKLLETKADLVLLKPISFIQLRELASRFRPS